MLKSYIFHAFLLTLCCGSTVLGTKIDNSSLIPPIKPDVEVKFEKSADGTREIPDWVKNLILVELRVDAVSTDGTLKGMDRALDHLAEMGVNCVWITPPLNGGNGYGNFGLHTISPRLTGEKEPAKQWAVLRNFVDQAHKRNIRVLFDVINWGVTKHEGGAKLPKEKPEWFGEYYPKYAGWLFNWKDKEFNEWFASRLVEWVLLTGVDGFRCDCSPFYAGYGPYETAKKRLRDMGYKTLFVAEWASARNNVFDFDQASMLKAKDKPRWVGDAFLEKNLVDMVKSGDELVVRDAETAPGKERFYTYMLSCHDSKHYLVKGSPVAIGYQAIFAPFLPLWYIGEEWNNPSRLFIDFYCIRDRLSPKTWSLYGNHIDWDALETNRAFFEKVKKMIRIRRRNPDIFEYFPDDHRNSNICKVTTNHAELLQPYARYRNGIAILIVPNNGTNTQEFRITIPFAEIGIKPETMVTVTDQMSDRTLATGKMKEFTVTIPAGDVGVFKITSAEQQ